MTVTLDLGVVDDLFAKRFAEGLTPGLVYGVICEGELIHSGALGTVGVDASTGSASVVPSTRSVFRIASMSKSFTAAALLLLRDRGLVDLDEAVAQYVPELVDQAPYATDSPAVTLRLLLTMAAGLPSDNPWGDRQEALTYDQFGTFLDGGFGAGAQPGAVYEYSNLGYALLGRVVANVAGGERPDGADRDFVEAELLGPLGLTSTTFDAGTVGPALVPGHVKRSTGWEELAPTPPGAFSAMGGLHSSVADLARWVGGFQSAFSPGVDGHPLSKASRREMQELHRIGTVTGTLALDGPEPGIGAVAGGYGFGLMVDHDTVLGRIVHHSGGYPGYGSRMVWHPDTGVGVVTLSNGTYAGAYEQAMTATRLLAKACLDELGTARWSLPVRRLRDPLERALDAGVERLRTFDLEGEAVFADPVLFADNVELDLPDAERRRQLRDARAKVGLPLAGPPHGYWSAMSAHAVTVVPAERGRYDVEVLLSPEAEPRLQSLLATPVPDAPEALVTAARRTLASDQPVVAAMRALGEPALLEAPVSCDGQESAEFLVVAGTTFWKVAVAPAGVTVSAHPTSAYPRLSYLATALRTD